MTLRERLSRPEILVAPGAYDALSAHLVEDAGFEAVYMTGYGVSASRAGFPDAGLISIDEMLEAVRALRRATALPLIADADTGFGNLVNVRRTVREYEAAGADAIQLEDQVFPKRCGHTLRREVIESAEMVRKVEVAVESRRSDDTLIVARTDARTALGLDEAIARGRRYAQAGADVVFVESPENEEELARVAGEIDAPTLANVVEGGRSPLLPMQRLQALGFDLAIVPVRSLLAAARAAAHALSRLRETGDPCAGQDQLERFETLTELVGFPELDAFLDRHAGG